MTKGGFLRLKVIGGKTYRLGFGTITTSRQNALDQAKYDRRHGKTVRVIKHPKKKLWAVYYY